jgi:hypothetical protein
MMIPQSLPLLLVEALMISIISDAVAEIGAHTDWELNKELCGFGLQ